MASLALRAFSSIASRAPQIFRTVWSTIKSSPTLNSIKDIVIGQVVKKAVDVMDNRIESKPEVIKNVWEIARAKIQQQAKPQMQAYNSRKKNLSFRIKKI